MHVLATGHQPGPMPSVAASDSSHDVAVVGHRHPTRLATATTPVVRAVAMPAAMSSAVGELGCGGVCADHGVRRAPGWPHTGAHLLDVCLGILLAGALAGLLLLDGRRRPGAARAVHQVACTLSRVAAARRPRPPSLAQLCVLRT
ncbi:MAG: hypothetical protein ABI807_04215 [Sporichthyaceae bacterium]